MIKQANIIRMVSINIIVHSLQYKMDWLTITAKNTNLQSPFNTSYH